jgi:hypothetical protein
LTSLDRGGYPLPVNRDALEVLKWVGLVLAAGFVGYFGRYLAMVIIDKARSKKAPPPPEPVQEPGAETGLAEARLKLEKKKAKAQAKKDKKIR